MLEFALDVRASHFRSYFFRMVAEMPSPGFALATMWNRLW